MRSIKNLEQEVAALGDLSREELSAHWLKVYGCPPPRGVRRELLIRSMAWHLQARRLGGLSAGTKRRLKEAIRGLEAEFERKARSKVANASPIITGSSHMTPEPEMSGAVRQPADKSYTGTKERRSVSPGARLLRDWNGQTHVVDVIEDGFVFEGKVHRSLSAIAPKITGAHWSGPRFFGL